MVRLERTVPSPCCSATQSVVEPVTLSKATTPAAWRGPPSQLPRVLVDRFGDPLGVRVFSDNFEVTLTDP